MGTKPLISLERELFGCFRFFLDEGNFKSGSKGFGLIADNTSRPDRSSIASVGFGLSAYVIGVENGYITREEGLKYVIGTFKTFLGIKDHFNGMYPHFLYQETAEHYKSCEYSTIDSVIFINGAITADSYFNDPILHDLFTQLFARFDFRPFVMELKGRKVFRMAYNPAKGGDYRGSSDDPWIFHWHMTAEQLSMYFLAAATDTFSEEESKELFLGFERKKGSYGPYEYYYCPTNGLFVYQYSHAWVDFRGLKGPDGIDWFENSRIATLANKLYCEKNSDIYPTLEKDLWGLTACLSPEGYRTQHIEPNDLSESGKANTGVLPPSGALGSIPFTPEESIACFEEIARKYPESFGKYGFLDGILKQPDGSVWISDAYIGINKGITMLMIDNYLNGTTWKYYMKHPLIQKAIQKLGFERRD